MDTSNEFRVGDVVVLNTDDSLRMSVRSIEGEEIACQWVAGDSVRKVTCHRNQLRHYTNSDIDRTSAGYIINLTGKDIPDLIREAMLVGADGYLSALKALDIDELRQLREYATRLRLAAEKESELKGA